MEDKDLIKQAKLRMKRAIKLDADNARFFDTNICVYLDNVLELQKRKVEYAKQVIEIANLIDTLHFIDLVKQTYTTGKHAQINTHLHQKKFGYTLDIQPLESIANIAIAALEVYEKQLDTIEFDQDVHTFNIFIASHKFHKLHHLPTFENFDKSESEKINNLNIKYYAKEEFVPL